MRIAYVCRELATADHVGTGARVFAVAQRMARDGHEVFLVSEGIAESFALGAEGRDDPLWIGLPVARSDHRYFTETEEYADRVYESIRCLHDFRPLDVMEFREAGAEGLTVLRARRLLGDFSDVAIVVAPTGGEESSDECGSSFRGAITAAAERYCREQADALVKGSEGRIETYEHAVARRRSSISGRVRRDVPVSVVIPLYNQGHYLREAIDSVRRGGHGELEIIVVDDGSTDPRTIEVFDALDDVVKVRQPRAGLAAARNAGLRRVSAPYVMPLDADDMVAPGFIGSAVAALERQPGLGHVAGHLRYFGLLDYVHVPFGHVPGLSLVLNTYARATALFRREALLEIDGYDESLPAYEDWDLYIRLHQAGQESDVLPIVGQHYRRHSGSMSFGTDEALRLGLLQRLLRKHAAGLEHAELLELVQVMAHLWKTGYEPSASVRWLRDRRSAHV